MSNEQNTAVAVQASTPPSLLVKMAERFSVEPNKMLATLKATAFKGEVSHEQMMALLIVADQYGLNPWTKEIYAFPDKGGIVPVVGVDGWSRIINEHPAFDGCEFTYSPTTALHKGKLAFDWIECTIHRKDRSKPTVVREYFDEVVRTLNYANPWDSHPKRMHRHKTLIQAGRLAFGFVGIYDQDEAERIVERDITSESSASFSDKHVGGGTAGLKAVVTKPAAANEPPADNKPASNEEAKQDSQQSGQADGVASSLADFLTLINESPDLETMQDHADAAGALDLQQHQQKALAEAVKAAKKRLGA